MVPIPRRGHTPALLAAALLLATASADGRDKADPLNPRAEVPAVRHDSALATYRPLGEDRTIGWKDANDAAHRIGGWRAYAREAATPASGAASASPVGGVR